MSVAADDRVIAVCSKCQTAACWAFIFPCDFYIAAGVKSMRVSELRALNLEHPSYWERPEVQRAG
jgi:hypothetical protein